MNRNGKPSDLPRWICRLHPDDYADQRRDPDALDMNPLALLTGQDWLKITAFIAALIVAVTLAVTAYGHGITTSDRPAICHNLTPADCVAMVQEAR